MLFSTWRVTWLKPDTLTHVASACAASASDRGTIPSAKTRAKAYKALAPIFAELQAAGATSLRAIAAGLNDRGIPTARGEGKWRPAQVARVLARL
jgi:hypothetical protein